DLVAAIERAPHAPNRASSHLRIIGSSEPQRLSLWQCKLPRATLETPSVPVLSLGPLSAGAEKKLVVTGPYEQPEVLLRRRSGNYRGRHHPRSPPAAYLGRPGPPLRRA